MGVKQEAMPLHFGCLALAHGTNSRANASDEGQRHAFESDRASGGSMIHGRLPFGCKGAFGQKVCEAIDMRDDES